jgi:hypothetical protein
VKRKYGSGVGVKTEIWYTRRLSLMTSGLVLPVYSTTDCVVFPSTLVLVNPHNNTTVLDAACECEGVPSVPVYGNKQMVTPTTGCFLNRLFYHLSNWEVGLVLSKKQHCFVGRQHGSMLSSYIGGASTLK